MSASAANHDHAAGFWHSPRVIGGCIPRHSRAFHGFARLQTLPVDNVLAKEAREWVLAARRQVEDQVAQRADRGIPLRVGELALAGEEGQILEHAAAGDR